MNLENIQKLSQEVVDKLQDDSVRNAYRIEGVAMLHRLLVEVELESNGKSKEQQQGSESAGQKSPAAEGNS